MPSDRRDAEGVFLHETEHVRYAFVTRHMKQTSLAAGERSGLMKSRRLG
jgi:hypothetical protein